MFCVYYSQGFCSLSVAKLFLQALLAVLYPTRRDDTKRTRWCSIRRSNPCINLPRWLCLGKVTDVCSDFIVPERVRCCIYLSSKCVKLLKGVSGSFWMSAREFPGSFVIEISLKHAMCPCSNFQGLLPNFETREREELSLKVYHICSQGTPYYFRAIGGNCAALYAKENWTNLRIKYIR